jgi:protein-disulfide isomerase
MVFADAAKAGLDVTKLKSDMAASKIDLALAASHTLAEATHIDGTPAFIVNGKIREGAMDDGLFAQMTKK